MKHDIIIGGVFTVPRGNIIPVRQHVDQIEWKLTVGKSGNIWLYTDEGSSVWQSGGKGSRGCGGSEVMFKLADGFGSIILKGPWHSNSDAFLRDTGIDVRKNFLTWGVIGTGHEYDENSGLHKITGVVWFDDEPVKGEFDRVGLIAWEQQEKDPDTQLFSYSETEGGCSYGAVSMPYSIRVARGIQKPIEDIMGW